MEARPKIQDIARISGLSPATIDRVLNNRPGVSAKAMRSVDEAIRKLNDQITETSGGDGTYDVILPRQAGLSTEYLAAAFRFHANARGMQLRSHFVERLDPGSLVNALARCADQNSAGIAFQALEDPAVREVVGHLMVANIPLLTVVSDLAGLGLGYVGLDNRAAGRTAGFLMGLLSRGRGPVAIIWGGHLYRGHDEREFGFRSSWRIEHPQTEIMDVTCTQDDAEEAFERLSELLKKEPRLAGVYSVGGGILGAVRALDQRQSKGEPCVLIGHNLTANTREHLLNRKIDALIHQDMSLIAERSIKYLLSTPDKQRAFAGEVPTQIVIRENVSSHLNTDLFRDLPV
ncbi:LacI family DNA-binding transcriptional regulator [Mesorhizobium australafricanum]|uniref:LacI family DNA-binding transcriptional regulator n=1 Tax=Mesorhizobium australafricanum TaxID=3072311 RepID=A0ABU4WVZ4_9HYPH|nr:LacI family DNA-binding transcriptional regulator [Mesorhizobium sp. VK3E]MDX8440237.1 LacI family DNA-binding transcriptional regulator [Mesorhizobium sp. VK3E]